MELLKEIPENLDYRDCNFEVRKAVRTVLLNDKGEMALLYVAADNYHKLPGGGIEEGESKMAALQREVEEEVGAKSKVIDNVGIIIEYRVPFDQYPTGLVQISYCYCSKVVGELKEPSFTKTELAKKFNLKWVPFLKGLKTVKNDKPKNKLGKFIQKRDLTFIKEAEKVIKNCCRN